MVSVVTALDMDRSCRWVVLNLYLPGKRFANCGSRGRVLGNDRSLDRVNFQAAELEGATPEVANPENAEVPGEHLNKNITLGDASLPDRNIYDRKLTNTKNPWNEPGVFL